MFTYIHTHICIYPHIQYKNMNRKDSNPGKVEKNEAIASNISVMFNLLKKSEYDKMVGFYKAGFILFSADFCVLAIPHDYLNGKIKNLRNYPITTIQYIIIKESLRLYTFSPAGK